MPEGPGSVKLSVPEAAVSGRSAAGGRFSSARNGTERALSPAGSLPPDLSWPSRAKVSFTVNLGFELDREVSPATYLWQHRLEFLSIVDDKSVLAAIRAGMALENWQLASARRSWAVVMEAARRAGRSARRSGQKPRRIVADIDQVRAAAELVLFDGRLPPDLAAHAARCASNMCARALNHALRAYWEERPAIGTG